MLFIHEHMVASPLYPLPDMKYSLKLIILSKITLSLLTDIFCITGKIPITSLLIIGIHVTALNKKWEFF